MDPQTTPTTDAALGAATRPDDTRADALLAVRCQLGERAAFDDLIRRFALPLRRYVVRVVGNADVADELVQDTWLQLLQGIGRLREPARLRAFLFGIAHRRVMDHLRARYAVPPGTEAELDALAADGPEPDAGLEAREIERGLERLPPVEREVLSLFYLDELSLAEVSQVLGIPVGTVKSRLHRARNLLRNHVTGESHD
jgi:RNA polymerase sigma-70 factor (ECF subfamily)